MKCIKAIKSQKTAEIGNIARINDVDAELRVRTGYWKYISKSEWKNKINENAETLKPKIDSELKEMGVSEKNRNFVKEEIDSMKKGKNKKKTK
jgi:hypothetical protein